jgi:hypothetical protein
LNCTTDFNPLIIATSAAIPVLIGILSTWLITKKDLSHIKGRQYATLAQGEKLLYIIENGFHGPPGHQGVNGADGQPGPAGPPGLGNNSPGAAPPAAPPAATPVVERPQ